MKVRATRKCFVGNAMREEDEIFDYDGPEDALVEPLEQSEPAKKAVKKPEKE